MPEPVLAAQLVDAVRAMGVGVGTYLVVHSSLSSFGRFQGGAPAVIDALQRAVGPDGILMMPAFSYGRVPFAASTTPTIDGAVAEIFRLTPGVHRSQHPTHSVTAWGSRAEAIVASHPVENPFGTGSPLHRLAESGCGVLLIGVTHKANSLIHVAQDLARVPYLDRFRDAPVQSADGTVRTVRTRRAGCSLGFDRGAPSFVRSARIDHGPVGQAELQLFDGKALLEEARRLLVSDPFSLLCQNEGCSSCDEAKRLASGTREGSAG